VLDVGAGTGKLSRALEPSGAEVIAAEPVAGMRRILTQQSPSLRVLDATAEALPLAPASIDAVVAGQAFHWFDGPVALREFDRVLRPAGRLALIWNRRDSDQPLQRAIEAIFAPYRRDTPSHRGHWRQAFEGDAPFEAEDELAVPFVQELDREQLLARVVSTSFVAALGESERRAVEQRVRALAPREPLELRYVSEVSLFRRKAR
jgi:SAM-dependent methyltransferase